MGRYKRRAVVIRGAHLLLVLFTLSFSTIARSARRFEELFRIERNTNRNVVRYDARLTKQGGLDPSEPIAAYWILLAEDGRRESLTWLERQLAYGFTALPDAEGARVTLKAFDRRVVHVRRGPSGYRAEIRIAGKSGALKSIWVQADSGVLGPTVRYLELHGVDTQTGEPLIERISKK